MTTATFPIEHHKAAAEIAGAPNDQPAVAQVPDMSPTAWRVTAYLLIGAILFLTAVGAYVISGIFRFQDCL